MPPSIPPPGGVNDASTGGATTRLPLIRETNRNSKEFNKSSSRSAIKSTTQRLSSATRKVDINRSSSNLLLRNNNRKKIYLRKNKQKSGRTPAPSPSQRTIAKVENDSDNSSNNIESSLNTVPASSTSPLDATGLAPYGGIGAVSPYGFYGGGASMMPPSPFTGMGMNGMGMNGMGMNGMGGLPYLSGLNQMVYNVQNIIISISQAIQVVSANQQALQHAWESLNQMVDHAVSTFHEMRALESIERECETEEERNKRKRLKALRYAFVFGGGWLAYKLIRNLLFRKRSLQLRHYGQSNLDNLSQMASPGTTAMSNYSSPNNFHGAMNMGYPGYSSNYHSLGNGYY
jgi:hypothetical protein